MTTMGPAFDREYALLSKIEALTIERDAYRAAMEQTIVAGERGNDLSGPIHRMRKLLGWPDKGVPARQGCICHTVPNQVCDICQGVGGKDKVPSSDDCPDCVYMVQTYGHGCFMHSSKDPEPARCRCGATMDDEHTYYCKNAPRSGEEAAK